MKIRTDNISPVLEKGQPVAYDVLGSLVYGHLLQDIYFIDGGLAAVQILCSSNPKLDKLITRGTPVLVNAKKLVPFDLENYEKLKQLFTLPMTPNECFSTSQQP